MSSLSTLVLHPGPNEYDEWAIVQSSPSLDSEHLRLRKALNPVSKKAKLKKLMALPVAAILITLAIKYHVFGRFLYAFAVSSCFGGASGRGLQSK
jgi:hypothetical protein